MMDDHYALVSSIARAISNRDVIVIIAYSSSTTYTTSSTTTNGPWLNRYPDRSPSPYYQSLTPSAPGKGAYVRLLPAVHVHVPPSIESPPHRRPYVRQEGWRLATRTHHVTTSL